MFYHSVTFSEVEHHKSVTLAYRTDKLAHIELYDASNVIGLSEPPISVTMRLTKTDVEKLLEHMQNLLTKFD
jgi:hypothetical protein